MTLYSTLLFPVSRSTCFGHIPCRFIIIKYCTVSSCWNFLKLIHDAQNDKHKKKEVYVFIHNINAITTQVSEQNGFGHSLFKKE
jgi:hypothetical protein